MISISKNEMPKIFSMLPLAIPSLVKPGSFIQALANNTREYQILPVQIPVLSNN
ncbi:MAG: hypothetical protein KAH26_01600 [Bacteroidales bacterium]|nr:hypothetical protein [Bacteroidales bacterium]